MKMDKLVLVLSALFLSGCYGVVDDATLTLNENGRIDGSMTIVAADGEGRRVGEEGAEITTLDSEFTKSNGERFVDEMRNCIAGTVNQRSNPQEIRISVRDQTADQIREAIHCIPDLEKNVTISLTKDRGFFRDSVTLQVELSFPQLRGELMANMRRLVINMPNSVEANILKDDPAINVSMSQPETSSIIFNFEPVAQELRRRSSGRRSCGNEIQCIDSFSKKSTIIIVAKTNQNKYGLSDLLAFFSILFGSGIAVTVGSRILSIRTTRKDDKKH